MVIFIILFAVVMVVITLNGQFKGATARQQVTDLDALAQNGIPAQGIVLQAAPTGTKVVIGMRRFERRSVVFEIEVFGHEPYTVGVVALIPTAMLKNVLPGATLDLRLDPKDRNHIAVVPPGGGGLVAGPPMPSASGAMPGAMPGPAMAPPPLGAQRRSKAPAVLMVISGTLFAGMAGIIALALASDGGKVAACRQAATCCRTAGAPDAACAAFNKAETTEAACRTGLVTMRKTAASKGRKCN